MSMVDRNQTMVNLRMGRVGLKEREIISFLTWLRVGEGGGRGHYIYVCLFIFLPK